MVYNDLRSKLNEYNWDDGFEIPKQILAAPSCDLALALEIFYLSDGYAFLDDSTKTTDLKEWGKFIAVLYDDILNDKFPKTSTAFEIPLSCAFFFDSSNARWLTSTIWIFRFT